MQKGLFVIGLDAKEKQFGEEVTTRIKNIEGLDVYPVVNAVPSSRYEIHDPEWQALRRIAYDEVLQAATAKGSNFVIDVHSTKFDNHRLPNLEGALITSEPELYVHLRNEEPGALIYGSAGVEEGVKLVKLVKIEEECDFRTEFPDFMPDELAFSLALPYVGLEVYLRSGHNSGDYQREIIFAERLVREICKVQETR
ncbi:MAG: hypothetical protein QF632_02580 [Candidatus Woesearchaeota archaeon]|jgi:hypothetical protein|nr:hypothetical protein [Candidatus Woesearchaeota archaeon]